MTPAQYRLLRNLCDGAPAHRDFGSGFETCVASVKHRGWVTYRGNDGCSYVRDIAITAEGRAALEKQARQGIKL